MTDTIRTRDEQTRAMITSYGNVHNNCIAAWIERHILEAEARGAAEQRQKDADGQERWYFKEPEYHFHGMGCGLEDRGIHARYQAMEYGWDQAIDRCIERIPDELYTRPANVTTLEARVRDLEARAKKDAEVIRWLANKLAEADHTSKADCDLLASATYVSRENFSSTPQ